MRFNHALSNSNLKVAVQRVNNLQFNTMWRHLNWVDAKPCVDIRDGVVHCCWTQFQNSLSQVMQAHSPVRVHRPVRVTARGIEWAGKEVITASTNPTTKCPFPSIEAAVMSEIRA